LLLKNESYFLGELKAKIFGPWVVLGLSKNTIQKEYSRFALQIITSNENFNFQHLYASLVRTFT
jgi:hypothetical protein